jgi:hypothetical protein
VIRHGLTPTELEQQLTPTDRAALELAIAMARKESPAQRRQIDDKLKTEPWVEVGVFASYCCQDHNLKLKPWQTPPIWIDPDVIEAELAEPGDDTHGRRKPPRCYSACWRLGSAVGIPIR